MKPGLAAPAVLLATLLVTMIHTAASAASPADTLRADIANLYPDIEKLYLDLHQSPELSTLEEKTSAKLAERMQQLGYDVTTRVGGTGVVAILENGKGKTLMIRTDMDALPVREQTGLPYASRVTMKDITGETVPVMHACGHDVHMSAWIGTATLLAKHRNLWKGTVMFIGQPAEERVTGAKAMLADGLFERFPKPDVALAIHDYAYLPAGAVGITPGYALANSDSVDLTVYGAGGHGAAPHTTVDPIVIAARIVNTLQTIKARELDPLTPAVITVGSFHGGAKHNIIPDEVKLQLTVRSYEPEVRKHLLEAIERIAKAEAAAARAPKEPVMKVVESTRSTYNDPALSARVEKILRPVLGEANVQKPRQELVGEDFSEYIHAGVPGLLLWVGAVEQKKYDQWKAGGPKLPSLHSPFFAPDREPTLKTAILAETLAALELIR